MENNEEIIKEFFKGKGFSITKIHESDQKTADFFVTDAQNKYLIEFKIKTDEEGLEQKRKEILKKGEIFSIEESTGRSNAISKKITIAKKQLGINLENDVFKIIWCHAAGRFPEVHFDQLKATLYGSTDIITLGENGPMLPCLYFTFSEFYRYKESLDAAILTYADKAQFCVNNYSPNYEKIKSTKLFHTFIGGIYDPIIEESKGKAYIVDCDIDRRNGAEILQYIQKKYGKKKMLNMNMKLLSGEIAINKNLENR